MRLTAFSHAALLLDAGLLLGLFLSKMGWEAYGAVIFVTVCLVLWAEWRDTAASVRYSHEERDG